MGRGLTCDYLDCDKVPKDIGEKTGTDFSRKIKFYLISFWQKVKAASSYIYRAHGHSLIIFTELLILIKK